MEWKLRKLGRDKPGGIKRRNAPMARMAAQAQTLVMQRCALDHGDWTAELPGMQSPG
jgi:hypothetical protein